MKETFEQIYEKHGALVTHISKEFARYPDFQFHREDLIQVGNIGLAKAYETFEEEKGYMFTTWAGTIIRNKMREYYRDLSSQKRRGIFNQVSTELPIGHDGEKEITVADFIPTAQTTEEIVEQNFIQDSIEQAIKQALNTLTPVELIIFQHQFEIDADYLTQAELGKALGFTQTKVSRIRRNAISKIKTFLQESLDEEILEQRGA